ncbi:MAG: CRISPR-associated helicase Cas3' [Candidatus Binatia bacterium]
MNTDVPLYIAHRREKDGATQTLEDHLLGVANIAKSLAAKIGFEEQGELIGLLHDLGKYSKEFQTYIQSAVGLINPDEDDFVNARGLKGKVDHSTAGAQLIWKELSKRGEMGQIVGQILALCIASHHSGLIDCLSSDAGSLGEDVFSKRMGKLDDRTHLQEAMTNRDTPIAKRSRELMNSPGLTDGLKASIRQVMLSDLIKGVAPNQNPLTQFKTELLVRFLFSCLIDADRINTANFENPEAAAKRLNGKYSEWSLLIERLERYLQGFDVRYPIDQLRRRISDQCHDSASRGKGIYTLTVPTGGGKTLASLRFALHHATKFEIERVIYVIPFTSIIDQNADVVRKILEPSDGGVEQGSVVLEHHSNVTPEEQSWKSKILSENWDAPIIYTTSVQLLETLFGAGTRGARRMHQLANAVLVFDEIQTLPVNCIHLFCNAINFLVEQCGSTVVLCTATQPLLNRVEPLKGSLRIPVDNEIMPDIGKLFRDLKRVEVLNRRKAGGWSNEEIARLALDEAEQSKSCLVIVNTKKSAQMLFSLCRKETQMPIYHLSTNMCPAHRRTVLGEIRTRLDNEHLLCVSTQLIEAGVDVDFGSVIRFMAGLDSIAQAAGRCNRNGRPELGRVHVVNPSDESVDMLKDIRSGKDATARLLDEFEKEPNRFAGDLLGPDAMEWYFNYYFFDRRNDMDYPVSAGTLGHDDTLLNLLSVNPTAAEEFRRCHGRYPNLYLRQSFMAAAKAFKSIEAPTRGVIVPYGDAGKALVNELCSAFAIERQYDLLRKAQQYTVNTFSYDLARLREAHAVHEIQEGTDILYLDARFYSQEFGLGLTPTGEMEVFCV